MMNRRMMLTATAAFFALASTGARADIKTHKLALQISDKDTEKMNAVLNVAANVSRFYSGKGEEVEIEIVAFNAGMHMLRDDTSPVKDRIVNSLKSLPNISFKACKNTMDAMERNEGKPVKLVPNVDVVEAGVTRLIELSESGWTIVRP